MSITEHNGFLSRPPVRAMILWLIAVFVVSCGYLRTNPPPDAEKFRQTDPDHSAWLAAAANMLSGAGYGNGRTLQEKASGIYADLTGQFGTTSTGWTDAAIQWWLSSSYNTWPDNPFRLVTVMGEKHPVIPWDHPYGPSLIGEKLRGGNLVAASISWPFPGNEKWAGGHVLTCWGDDLKENYAGNKLPSHLRVTDSDRTLGGIIQTYRYDDFLHPNKDGFSAGPGWYIAYDKNHPFIKHIVILSPAPVITDDRMLVSTLVSFSFSALPEASAIGFSGSFSSDRPLSGLTATIKYEGRRQNSLQDMLILPLNINSAELDYTFPRNQTASNQPILLTLEYLCAPSPRLAAKGLMMTRGEAGIPSWPAVDLDLRVETVNMSERALKKDFTGGYLIGAMEVMYPDLENPGQDLVIPVRFEIQYPFNKNPEYHVVHLSASTGARARTLRFGHSYGWVGPDSLWDFNDWTTYRDSTMRIDGMAQVVIDWRGLFPYPKGEDITRKAADPGL